MILAMVTIHIIQNPRLIIACKVVTWIYSIDISMQIFAQSEKEEEMKLCQMTQGGLRLR